MSYEEDFQVNEEYYHYTTREVIKVLAIEDEGNEKKITYDRDGKISCFYKGTILAGKLRKVEKEDCKNI